MAVLQRFAIAVLISTLLGCAQMTRLHNGPIVGKRTTAGYGSTVLTAAQRDFGDTLIVLAFSGGGTRAAAFSYGVLEELRDTPVTIDAKPGRLLDQVDAISSVSGGSFTAAYYGLHGDGIFTDFEATFLRRSVQSELIHTVFSLPFWFKSAFKGFDRSEMAVDYYDREIFKGASFADMRRSGAPLIRINATDLGTGQRFQFNQDMFDLICSDLDSFPVARAVAASSAVPILFVPITLKNYGGTCQTAIPDGLRDAAENAADPDRQELLRAALSFTDSAKRPYVHLVDGGVADNLGLRSVTELVDGLGGAGMIEAMAPAVQRVRRIVVISVNSETRKDRSFEQSPRGLGSREVAGLVSETQFHRYNSDTLRLIRERLPALAAAISSPGDTVKGHFIEVSFESAQSQSVRLSLNLIPTSFELSPKEVTLLKSEARRILREDPDFQALLEELRETPNGVGSN